MARERGLLVSFDPNWRPSLWNDHDQARTLIQRMFPLSDIVKIADEEWEFVTGTTDFDEGSQQIRALGPKLVIITKGADGAYFNCEGASGHVEGFRADAVDTLAQATRLSPGCCTKWRRIEYSILCLTSIPCTRFYASRTHAVRLPHKRRALFLRCRRKPKSKAFCKRTRAS
jgi:fructokinase